MIGKILSGTNYKIKYGPICEICKIKGNRILGLLNSIIKTIVIIVRLFRVDLLAPHIVKAPIHECNLGKRFHGDDNIFYIPG